MKNLFWSFLGIFLCSGPVSAAELTITSLTSTGRLTVSNAYPNGIVAVEQSPQPNGPWTPAKSAFAVATTASLDLAPTGRMGLFRASAVDLSGALPPWTLAASDFLDFQTFALRLSFPPDTDALSPYLGTELSPATQERLFLYVGGPDPELEDGLLTDLNALMQRQSIYTPERFTGVILTPTTQALLAQPPSSAGLVELNRRLMEDAYPVELAQKRRVAFTNLVSSYGVLSTIAGSGQIACSACNSWNPAFEGGPATEAALSSPHIAMADRAGNIYIADKRGHAIRKVRPDGTIVTVAGTGLLGHGDSAPAPATTVALNNPNGLWVRADGSYYILDRDNGLIRKVDTNGIMTTVADNSVPIPGGRGLWVSEDESILYFAAGSEVKTWDATNGLAIFASGFVQVGNLAVDPAGNLVVTDSDASRVYRVSRDGTRTIIAGNADFSAGGDGLLATQTALAQVRAIWYLPTGGYFLGTDVGSQVWYVDTDGHIHLFLNGNSGSAHAGDGAWFYQDPTTPKVSFVKQITMDYDGNLLITEATEGYVRRIPFQRPPR
jgi:hypothetical protein